jgi:hypothetical protein
MPTAKKPAEGAKPASRTRKTTAPAAAKPEAPAAGAAKKPAPRTRKPAEPAVEAAAVTAPEQAPAAPKKDRTMAAAVAFLVAVALFAAGFGIGRASGDDRAVVIGNGGVVMHPGMGMGMGPYGDDGMPMYPNRPGQPGGGYLPGPNGPAQRAPQVADQGFLGITGVNATSGGAEVTEVLPGSPAAAAGLVAGDRITGVNGVPIIGMGQLANVIAATPPGTQLTLQVDRAGSTLTLTATLGSRAG